MSNHEQQQPQQPHPQQANPYQQQQQQQQQQPQVVFLPLFPNMNPEDLMRYANLLLPQLLNGNNNNNNNGMNNSNAGINFAALAQQSTANMAPNNNEAAAASLVAALASVAANPLANLATLFPNHQQQQIEHQQQPQVQQQQQPQVQQHHQQVQQQVQGPAQVYREPTGAGVPLVPVHIQAKQSHHRQQEHRQVPRGMVGATAPAAATHRNVAPPPLDIQPRPEAPPSNSVVAVQVKEKAAVSNGSSPIGIPAEDNSKTSAINQKPSLSPSSSTSSLSSNSPAEAEGGDNSKNTTSDDNTDEEEDERRSPSPTLSSSSSEGSSSLESLEMDIAYLREKQLLLERFSQEMQQDDLYDASNARMAIRQQEQERQDQDTLLSNSTVGSISDDEDESAEDLEGVSIWIRAKKVLRSLSRHRGVMYHPMSHHQSSSLDGKSKKKAAQTNNKDKKKKAVASKKRRVRFHDDGGDNQSTATSSSSEQDDVLPGRRTKYRKLIDRSVVRLMTAKDFSAEDGMLIRPHPQHLQASPQQAFATVPGTGFDDHSMKCLHSILTDVSSVPFHTSG